ncbi:MAG: chromosomal replication initiator protein DnaA [Verrucomicrobiota bacterium]|nr:chromosomal replication initiator protein DnaA [Verrucomicrobiota bacterium]
MADELNAIWKEICSKVREQVSADTFRRWFSSTKLIEADENNLRVFVPNHIYGLWIDSNYMAILNHAVTEVLGQPRKIQWEIGTGEAEANQQIVSDAPDPVLDEQVENKPAARNQNGSRKGPVAISASNNQIEKLTKKIGLNKNHRFDSFVVGSNNEYACAAAHAVSKGNSEGYNPLFIWGGPGLGKTHLLHAIGYEHVKRNPKSKIVYMTCEQFTNEFIEAIQNNALSKFRNRYRKADLLLVDDIHFLAGKEKSQEEFFHTFNMICDGRRHIVLTSDRPAAEISDLEERIVSRCEWGLTAGLELPDVETRLAILRKKMAMWQVSLEDRIVEFLADRIRKSVRRLEGAMMRLASYSSLSGKSLTDEVIEGLLKDILREEGRRRVTISSIQKEVALHFDVRIADMTARGRRSDVAFARQVAMYLSRTMTDHSLVEIGRAFGRDHGTVIHAVKKVETRMESSQDIRHKISILGSRLSSV